MDKSAPRAPRPRLLLFAFGDFAFNLYWQSLMLFLLFYYSDALELPISIAATIFMVGSIWDGIANFAAGILVDRRQSTRGYRTLLVAGSVPLALSFLLAYLPPLATGWWGIGTVFVGHLLFRTAYAAVNVPYLAMTARISLDSGDRALIAGLRMLFGTLAAVVVALGTIPLGEWVTGERNPVQSFLVAAAIFATIGTLILIAVGATYRESAPPVRPAPASVRATLTSLASNRAFVTLNLAMVAMIIAITVLNKSVLYYFKYVLGDPQGGQFALASMGLISAVAVPLWMALGRFVGLKMLWFLAAGPAMAMLLAIASLNVGSTVAMQGFLVGVQAMIVGLNFVFWAMLPNTIEYGERQTGLHVEGAVFGVAALIQRIAIGIATAILGWTFDNAGFVANVQQSSGALDAMRRTITLMPLAFFALSCAAMLLNPLGRGAHRRIVSELEAEAEADPA